MLKKELKGDFYDQSSAKQKLSLIFYDLILYSNLNRNNFLFISSEDFGFISKFVQEFVDGLKDDTSLSFNWSFYSFDGQTWLDIDLFGKVFEFDHLDLLFLGLEDTLNICESRSIQTQVNSEHCGDTNLDLLETEVHLAHDLGGLTILREFNLGRKSRTWDSHE
jgi:hypothetical protein